MSSRTPVTDKSTAELTSELGDLLKSEGFEHYGFAQLTTPISIALYENWLGKGFHGEMEYLVRHLPQKRDPAKLLKKARSAIVVTINYVPHPMPAESWPLQSNELKVARYAQGRDYHHFIKERLARLTEKIKSVYPEDEFVSFTDSSPVLERDLATRAGLGWIGKNTCLLAREHGSLFFIAEIFTTLNLKAAEVTEAKDFCGTCTRCIDACPTGAITQPRELDARKCISYLTIESRTVPPTDLREKMGSWFYGCDICQTVCPWNEKVFGRQEFFDKPDTRELLVSDLRFLLSSSNRALEKAFVGTPLLRAGGIGLKRNTLVTAANLNVSEVADEVKSYIDHPKLSELASWTLSKILPQEEPNR